MQLARIAPAGLVALLFTAAFPVAAPAATGLAYGSVTKFSTSGASDSAPPAPGTFSSDYQAAATPADTANSPHMPFGLGKMVGKMQGALAIFQTGLAEKHYIGIRKERVDNVAAQTADITDCTARTITHLDIVKRTYSVTSLDQPQPTAMPASRHETSAPGPMPTDDGSKVAVVMTTRALGPMTIEGVATNGYDTTIRMTTTRPTGETSTTNMKMTAYYAPFDEPRFSCSARLSSAYGSAGGASMASYATLMSALRSGQANSRFSVSNSGPPLPASRLAMWQDMTMSGSGSTSGSQRDQHGSAGSFGIIIERGNVRAPLSDGDPAFSVPAGFTKVDN